MNKILTLVLFLPAMCWAEISTMDLAQLTHRSSQLYGQFQQQKYLRFVDTSIFSTGTFAYQRDQFIEWHTLEPVENLTRISKTSMSIYQDGQEVSSQRVDTQPVLQIFNTLIFAVLSGDWGRLTEYFDIDADTSSANWQATLTPKTEELKRFVNLLELEGGDYVRQLTIQEPSGNYTRVQFSSLSEQR